MPLSGLQMLATVPKRPGSDDVGVKSGGPPYGLTRLVGECERGGGWQHPCDQTLLAAQAICYAASPMIDPVLVSLVSAATALVASVAGPFVTLYVGRAQIRAAVRSANRQRWIEEFRDLIAKFSGHIATAVQVRDKVVEAGRLNVPAQSEFLHQLELIVYAGTKIRMMINPIDQRHGQLVAEIDGLLLRFRTAGPDYDMQADAIATIRTIVDASLALIRDEWILVQRGL